MKISVVIVNYNVKGFLEQCLRSVEKASAGLSVETFVVDNASVDGSMEMVKQLFPTVIRIANTENVGFGKANNQAFKEATGDYIFVLNPDTIIREDTLSVLVDFMEKHPNCGASGCKILDPDGTFSPTSRRSFPTPEVSLYRILGLSKLFPKHPKFGKYNLTYLSENEVTEVDALSGSCMFIRKETLQQIVGFDEQFFMYGEDLDLCYRIQEAKWKIYYTPSTEIIHFKGESTKKGDLKYVKIFYGAMIIFMEKHFTSQYSKIFTFILKTAVWLRASVAALATFIRNYKAFILDLLLFLFCLILPEIISKSVSGGYRWEYSLQNAPIYALITLLLMRFLGAYPKDKSIRLRPVIYGWIIGFLCASSLPFFFKGMAFSRGFVIYGFVLGGLVLCSKRIRQYLKNKGTRRALLVGNESEFLRLKDLLSNRQNPFEVVGFLGKETKAIGTFSQLRDAIRLHQIDDVVFAEESIANAEMFALMQQITDLQVAFRIFPKGRNHLLGQASLSDLSNVPFIEVAHLGTFPSVYGYEKLAALGWILAFPLTLFFGFKTYRFMLSVLQGKKAIVGCSKVQQQQLPKNWKVVESLIPVFPAEISPEKLTEQYATYYQRKNWLLDIEIALR